jgi:spore coat polysaccharide biosynthesis protein SpsF
LPFEREHVTPFIYRRPERFRLRHVIQDDVDFSEERWTVDTPEDFSFAQQVLSYLGSMHTQYGYRDILTLLDHFPRWRGLNAGISQKSLEA